MIADGLKLMVLGMGMVFLFLTIMVILISISAKLLAPFAHLLEEPAADGTPASGNEDKNIVAAIIAAVHKHRNS